MFWDWIERKVKDSYTVADRLGRKLWGSGAICWKIRRETATKLLILSSICSNPILSFVLMILRFGFTHSALGSRMNHLSRYRMSSVVAGLCFCALNHLQSQKPVVVFYPPPPSQAFLRLTLSSLCSSVLPAGSALGRRFHPDEVVWQGLYGVPEVPQEDHERPLRGGVPVLHGGDEHRVDGRHPEPQWTLPASLQAALWDHYAIRSRPKNHNSFILTTTLILRDI